MITEIMSVTAVVVAALASCRSDRETAKVDARDQIRHHVVDIEKG
jgi:hypothetical protein